MQQLCKGKGIAITNSLFSLQSLIGSDGLLRVGGRLHNSKVAHLLHHPVILHKSSLPTITTPGQGLCWTLHTHGLISRRILCLRCEEDHQKNLQRLCYLPQGLHPNSPSTDGKTNTGTCQSFNVTGVDLAGPFLCNRGNPRKPNHN